MGVCAHEINERFPLDLLGLQLVGALKRYFAIPGYKLMAAEAPPAPAAILARLLKDLDRTRRETNVLEGADVLWALNERLWYTAGFVGPSVEEAVPSRALCVLETLSTKSQPQYLPAGVLTYYRVITHMIIHIVTNPPSHNSIALGTAGSVHCI